MEYHNSINKALNGEVLLRSCISELRIFLEQKHSVFINPSDVMILDSCTMKKTSFHLIVPAVVFENIYTCKLFVEAFATHWETKDPDCRVNLFNGARKCFIDMSVYRSNQNMRLLYSSKERFHHIHDTVFKSSIRNNFVFVSFFSKLF